MSDENPAVVGRNNVRLFYLSLYELLYEAVSSETGIKYTHTYNSMVSNEKI